LNELLPTISKLDNVFYHGSINQVDVDTILSKHNFFINPSEFGEMSPLSLIDALRVGLIPIVSNAPGNLNYIKNDINGFVFEMGNLSNLVCVLDKIRHLIKNNQLFLHESYFQDYRFSDYNKLYLKVIE
jgi:glycosyltransferase involved in cell wall biosynthesis